MRRLCYRNVSTLERFDIKLTARFLGFSPYYFGDNDRIPGGGYNVAINVENDEDAEALEALIFEKVKIHSVS
jgi:hypothetical protein